MTFEVLNPVPTISSMVVGDPLTLPGDAQRVSLNDRGDTIGIG